MFLAIYTISKECLINQCVIQHIGIPMVQKTSSKMELSHSRKTTDDGKISEKEDSLGKKIMIHGIGLLVCNISKNIVYKEKIKNFDNCIFIKFSIP